jgi:molecular chaperone GrpE (heat shock protein)
VTDALLLGAVGYIYSQSKLPLGQTELALGVFCLVAGCVLAVAPFILEYRTLARLAEANELTSVVARINDLERIAAQIGSATAQWQEVQKQAEETKAGSEQIAGRMGEEVKAFTEFLQKANDGEKSTLRLEVDKLRRAEGDWVQVLVRMLDHVFALHQGAMRSGQPNLMEQVGNFHAACRDVARRVGLTPFAPAEADPFDPQRHQTVEGNGQPPSDALVGETIASGYTLQGRMIRPALVRLRNGNGKPTEESPVVVPAPAPLVPEPPPAAAAVTEPAMPEPQAQLPFA